MDSEEFVSAVEKVVLTATAEGVQKVLEHPPGRSPAKELVELSRWYTTLNEADRKMVERIISKTARNAVFGFLCVLDGVRVIEDDVNKGELKLYFVKGSESVLLNDPTKGFLHEMLSND